MRFSRRHPDKTDHPMAEDKFVEITKAYEVSYISCLKEHSRQGAVTREDY